MVVHGEDFPLEVANQIAQGPDLLIPARGSGDTVDSFLQK